jgi:hypothetical protein
VKLDRIEMLGGLAAGAVAIGVGLALMVTAAAHAVRATPSPEATVEVVGVYHRTEPEPIYAPPPLAVETIAACPAGQHLTRYPSGLACEAPYVPEPAKFLGCVPGYHPVPVPVSRERPDGVDCRSD